MGAGPAPASPASTDAGPGGWLGLGGEAAAPLGAEQMQPTFYAPFAGAGPAGDEGEAGAAVEPPDPADVAGDSVVTGAGAATLVPDEDDVAPAGGTGAATAGALRVFANFGGVEELRAFLNSAAGGSLRAMPRRFRKAVFWRR